MSSSPVRSPYGYVPTEWVGIAFVSLFAVSTATHFVQAIYYRTWWLLATAFMCGLLEIGGWAARLWSSFSPTLLKPYIIQTTATIIGPTPLLATNFIILGRLIGRLGPQYSRLPPKIYSIIFTGCDVVALIVQGFGGVKASQAVANHEDPEVGGHIMLGGIIFQMAAIVVYVILASEFLLRLFKNRPLKRSGPSTSRPVEIESTAKQMIIGLVFMTTCIFLRSIYRTIELINGFTGVIITTQIYFILFDGALIVLAIYALNVFHPGRLMRDTDAKHMPLSVSEEEMPLEYRYDKWNVEQGSGSYDPYKAPYNPYKAPYNP
ncbi:hypothetical protein EVG20_g4352 [Dentipellis fragilis]|uniref:RTA1 like protein n=1 Tax=Dentipellis fragilis TaxID=205917 RepID=A0A4Y9YVX2_9AGAM|nr:hypothetical protein EVG20_g4352 [Dentipellis fragilis]